MRKSFTALALGLLMMAPPALVPDASAAHASRSGWRFGTGFWIDGLQFTIGYAPRHGHRPDYYFRVESPIRYRGYRCTDRCHRRGGHHYHHATCPVLRHHLDRHDYHYGGVLARFAPDYGRERGYRGRRGHRGYHDDRPSYRYERRRHERPRRSHRHRHHRPHRGGSCPY